jgi:GNAT superfamily N-acetyltransferase
MQDSVVHSSPIERRTHLSIGENGRVSDISGAKAAIRLVHPQSARQWRTARVLVEEYVGSLDLDLSFQNIAAELEHLAMEYGPPSGAFFLAEEDGHCLGCAGVREFSTGVGEVKRLYVRAIARGRDVGRLLAERVLVESRALGYRRLLLDTLPSMSAAQSLYVSLGFKPTAPYRFNPVPGTRYLELPLA